MPNWNKRNRLEMTIAGEASDRPPVTLWRHWPGDDQHAGALAAAHLGWQRDYDWDLIKVSPSSSFCLADWGAKDSWHGSVEGTRAYGQRVVQRPEDWEMLHILDPRRGMLATQIEALRLIGEGLPTLSDPGVPFIATVFSPLAQAKNLAGGQELLNHMRSNPDALLAGLETITKSIIAYIQAAKETGISGIFYAIQHARYELLSPAEYERFGGPFDERILEATSDLWLNMLHVHGESGIMFDQVAHYPVQLVNWHDRDSGFSLSEGLERVSGAVSGGVSRWALYQESPEQTTIEASDAIQQTGSRRLLLGVGCVAMTNTPLRNIRALRDFVDGV
ncbi:unnamed protein product [marine sediment metagenome]|uniref:Uroporphyrinogen decarboxylase (URO-D) domain-containing protein n=1 Tax=marine sediment metagenome TaxID=412755 RepID=X1T8B8_9ZZZZ